MLKLNVGTNRKIGQPDYGSAGASCNLEVELDTALFHDLDGLHQVVQRAYSACNQAVNDELARLSRANTNGQHSTEAKAGSVNGPVIQEVCVTPVVQGARVTKLPTSDGHHAHHIQHTATTSTVRPATTSQVRAIRAICARRKIDLVTLLQERYGIRTADELGVRQASGLIDELKNDGQEGVASSARPSANGHSQADGAANGRFAMTGGAR
jgi:hypothetical protein